MATHWVIDWRKIQTVEDIKTLLSCCDLHPRPMHPDFVNLKPLCKLIDDDGREVPEPVESPSLVE